MYAISRNIEYIIVIIYTFFSFKKNINLVCHKKEKQKNYSTLNTIVKLCPYPGLVVTCFLQKEIIKINKYK